MKVALHPDVVPFAEILLAGLPAPAPLRTICAWCPDFDRTASSNRGASHGICPACAATLLAECAS